MRILSGARIGRFDFLIATILVDVLFKVAVYLAFGRFILSLQIALRSSVGMWTSGDLALAGMAAVADVLFVWFASRRLRDIGLPGWYALALPLCPLLLGFAGSLASLAVLIALVVWPGTIGPNAYGPDPRGWKSQEQFAQQQERLRNEKI